ncbi:S1C family serine protease [Haloferula sp.]|uniref:S1C family serine protease n=1 Tax=Haloferula sp. TaxID=2497595 RepID=UPI003C771EAA
MKITIRHFLMLAGAASPLHAIEPPVEAPPIPPRSAPAEKTVVPPRAVPVVPELEAPKAVPVPDEVAARPYIGVILDPVPELVSAHLKLAEGEGLVIGDMVSGGPAETAGLVVNDIITRVDGVSVGSSEEVRRLVEKHAIGDQVSLEVIHNGERQNLLVTLGAAPDLESGIPQAGLSFDGAGDLEGFLGNLPEKHADLMRQAMEQRLQALGQFGGGSTMPDNWQRDLLKKMERGMKGGGNGLDFGEFKAEATARLFDEEGSIEVKGVDGQKDVRVFDKAGKLVWEGPYDTEEDKAAVPPAIRERIDRVDLDMNFQGEELFQQGIPRFKPLDDLEPDSSR